VRFCPEVKMIILPREDDVSMVIMGPGPTFDWLRVRLQSGSGIYTQAKFELKGAVWGVTVIVYGKIQVVTRRRGALILVMNMGVCDHEITDKSVVKDRFVVMHVIIHELMVRGGPAS
jgi:hypothetical protein